MSFFRNLRSSITRGRSSSRDTTPVRNVSRPGSVISGIVKRRDSVDSGSDSVIQRSDTFILDDHNGNGSNSNCSTLEKKSKKSKVLEKFSTFTKRKKTPTPDSTAYEHHPSDNATNTYYKWQADGGNSLDYDSHTDPFNFLYDQTSLKSIHNGSSAPDSMRSSTTPTFDSSTYRKGKMPKELKKQLEHLKQTQNLAENEDQEHNDYDEHDENDAHESDSDKRAGFDYVREEDKYKTVTLNSLRKSFRDKFMHHQKEAPHNPSWFVEVDPPPLKPNRECTSSKENRTDFLVFDNDNYRPGSRSPVRELNSRKPARSATRSPVKRNDTFKVDRNGRINETNGRTNETSPASIRIEFRNSITPNVPGRMVPVGVAKPMPSQITTPLYGRQTEPSMNSSYSIKTSTTRLNSHQSPLRNWSKPLSRSPSRPSVGASSTMGGGNSQRSGRYQTLVQIKDNSNGYRQMQQAPAAFTARPSRLSTRIQLGGSSTGLSTVTNSSPAPAFAKRYNHTSKTQPPALRQTYFGDSQYVGVHPLTSARLVQTPALSSPNVAANCRTYGHRMTAAPALNSKYQTPQHHTTAMTTSSSSLTTLTPSRSTPSYSAVNNGIGGGGGSVNGGGGVGGGFAGYLKHQQQPSRIVVASQRRSRSPIKIPWR